MSLRQMTDMDMRRADIIQEIEAVIERLTVT